MNGTRSATFICFRFHFPQSITPHSTITLFMVSYDSSLSSLHVLILTYVYLCGSLVTPVRSGTLPEGSPCSTANNRIDKLSHRFMDGCDDKTFCSGSVDGTCIPKRCRTDVFPFGYKEGDVLPPLCDPGGGCRPLVEVGQPCQLNQDRQCAPPPDWQELASDWNFNGSVCLGSVCSPASITLGQPCLIDSTDYVSPGPNGQEFVTTVIRHNCRTPQLFCNLVSHICEPTKPPGFQCNHDQECQSVGPISMTKTRGYFPLPNYIQVQLRIPEPNLYSPS
ncbi:hypothetical protein BDM02DRAFT_3121170 [Thelephora ganbajun]|uniref:Uncharacterized protein n=1 Tax=Thelephora ganbajun TaxID=370292 RepID=A0ACB6Z5L8_THEGA|nr:hypothetical protein BDM02DRAFT_3121170 [Thelephora ganbajun]